MAFLENLNFTASRRSRTLIWQSGALLEGHEILSKYKSSLLAHRELKFGKYKLIIVEKIYKIYILVTSMMLAMVKD